MPQVGQRCGLSARWDLRWRRSLVASVYARPHCGQGKGLSPECRRSWARSVCGSRSAFPHTGHRWASPVWEMRWRRSSGRCGKASAQCGQRYGRSPVCSRRCPRRLPRWRKARPQCGHGKGIFIHSSTQYGFCSITLPKGFLNMLINSQVFPESFSYHLCECCSVVSVVSDSATRSPPGSSIHGILQARILEWITMPSSRGSS